MKKLINISFLLICLIPVTRAQFIKAGGGLVAGSGFHFHQLSSDRYRSGIVGATVNGIYELNPSFQISPSFTIFYPHKTEESSGNSLSVSSMMFDINGHYIFNPQDRFEYYGLAGLNILLTKMKSTYTGSAEFKESDNAPGFNLGVGTSIKLFEKVSFNAEARYLFNNKYNQLLLKGGILLSIDRTKRSGK